ncbi:hypothetical protein [Bartonella henselae]|uniref:hypothetical protein n=1 Tax=Bartonella henselae TaxID=38323 RepID=UPI0011781999|nr:hypothetical protein [Bartonella henselae]UJM34943.1 hypothetical protein KAE75_03420 [Bartonella henselae]
MTKKGLQNQKYKQIKLDNHHFKIYARPKRGDGIISVISINGWIIKSNPKFDDVDFQDQLDNNGNLIAIKCAIYLSEKY